MSLIENLGCSAWAIAGDELRERRDHPWMAEGTGRAVTREGALDSARVVQHASLSMGALVRLACPWTHPSAHLDACPHPTV